MPRTLFARSVCQTLLCAGTFAARAAAAPVEPDESPLHPAPEVAGSKLAVPSRKSVEHSSGIWMLGIQRSVWRAADTGISQGYAGVLHFAALGRNRHFVGRRVATLALGGSSAGFEGRLHSAFALGGDLYTLERGLAYLRGGFELLAAGNAHAKNSLLVPLLEIGHLWSTENHHVDLGLRLDWAALGSVSIDDRRHDFQPRLDFGGYLDIRYALAILDLAFERRQFRREGLDVLHVEGSVCGGTYVVVCTRLGDYWIHAVERHVTELTFSLGVGSVVKGR